jgi:hypothetical protein
MSHRERHTSPLLLRARGEASRREHRGQDTFLMGSLVYWTILEQWLSIEIVGHRQDRLTPIRGCSFAPAQGHSNDGIRVISPGPVTTKRVTAVTSQLVSPRSYKVGLTHISTYNNLANWGGVSHWYTKQIFGVFMGDIFSFFYAVKQKEDASHN